MLSKILFTLLVIIIVALVFRTKTSRRAIPVPEETDDSGSLPVRAVSYIIIGVLVVISTSIFVFKYQSDNKIINIRVISAEGADTLYQARQKQIKGRQFTTLESKLVKLGESDRMEINQ